jgi:hypothetical protein
MSGVRREARHYIPVTELDTPDGGKEKENVGHLRRMPRCYPCRKAAETKSLGMNYWRAECLETCKFSSGRGRRKRLAQTRPRWRPTPLLGGRGAAIRFSYPPS